MYNRMTQQIFCKLFDMKSNCCANLLILALISLVASTSCYQVSVFYCGFSNSFCGQSTYDDVHSSSSVVVLSFADIKPDGTVIIDETNYPADLISQWARRGKSVVISVGGHNGNWRYAFNDQNSNNNFVESLTDIVRKYRLNGVDLYVPSYFSWLTSPASLANTIKKIKIALNYKVGRNMLIVTPQDIGIYQGATVPNPNISGAPTNYFVPIVQMVDDYIDMYQPQAFNNWYGGVPGGSVDYFKDVYLNWRNLQGVNPSNKPIPGFSGIAGRKLRVGFLGAASAGQAAYYGSPQTIRELKQFLRWNNYELNGFTIWNSYWDKFNDYAISKACAQ